MRTLAAILVDQTTRAQLRGEGSARSDKQARHAVRAETVERGLIRFIAREIELRVVDRLIAIYRQPWPARRVDANASRRGA